MKRHDADISAFVFGLLFILAAAFATQAGTFALGEPTGDTWIAPALLLGAGVLAVIGTLVAAPPPHPSGSTERTRPRPSGVVHHRDAAPVETARPDPAPVSSRRLPIPSRPTRPKRRSRHHADR